MCNGCAAKLHRANLGQPQVFPNVDKFCNEAVRPDTRPKQPCACHICRVARKRDVSARHMRPAGRRHSVACTTPSPPSPSPAVTCRLCLSFSGKGKPHSCTLAERRQILVQLIGEDPSGGEMLFSSGGVRRILILALAPGVTETYCNMYTLMRLLNLTELGSFVLAADMKMANIISGIQAPSSTYPCLMCEKPRRDFELETPAALSTVSSIKKNQKLWDAACQTARKVVPAGPYKNCVKTHSAHSCSTAIPH